MDVSHSGFFFIIMAFLSIKKISLQLDEINSRWVKADIYHRLITSNLSHLARK